MISFVSFFLLFPEIPKVILLSIYLDDYFECSQFKRGECQGGMKLVDEETMAKNLVACFRIGSFYFDRR